jgi:ABC-type sugar transport system substrate-binding protein
MRSFYRRAALAVTSLGLLGLVGCGEDNESEVRKAEAKGGESAGTTPQPQNMEEYAAQQKKLDTGTKGGAYSAPKKGGAPKK